MTRKSDILQIDAGLMQRLKVLASRSGQSSADLVETVLRRHADEEERKLLEQKEDEQRWQRYLSEGHAVPFETVRNKLHGLAAEAAQKADPQ